MALQYGSGGSISVYMAGPFSGGSGSTEKITNVYLPVIGWKGAASPYSQEVSVGEVSVNSRVDLILSEEQLSAFYDKDLVLFAQNSDGVVTVFAIGDKPLEDLTIQAIVTEVVA